MHLRIAATEPPIRARIVHLARDQRGNLVFYREKNTVMPYCVLHWRTYFVARWMCMSQRRKAPFTPGESIDGHCEEGR